MLRVYLDSCIVIYLHEGASDVQVAIRDRLLPLSGDRPVVYISDLARLECRVRPLRDGDTSLLADYDRFFSLPDISRLSLSTDVFDLATDLRAQHGLRTPDALHLAVALEAGCDRFWTNDHRLAKVEADIVMEVLP